jgi:sortase A
MTSETHEPASTGPASNDPMARVVEILRRNPWARRGLSAVSVLLLAGAIGMIGFPYISNVLQSREQSNLDRQLDSDELAQAYRNRRVAIGDALTRVKIPAIDVDVVVVEGTTASALRAGAGHYPATPLPCEKGNVAIAGHRTTYGRPFHNLDLLKNKDLIILETPIGTCTYEVSVEPFAVQPDDISVVANTPNDATLTLTTCHPKGSARQRLIIHAKMIKSEFYDA